MMLRILLLIALLTASVISRSCVIDGYVLNQPTCLYTSDGSLQIQASGATGIEYSIDGGLSFSASNTFTNLAPGTYIVVIQSPQPCTQSDTIYIAPQSFLSASATISDNEIFPGEAITFSSSAIHATSFGFSFGDGTDTSGLTQVQHTYPTAGNYQAFFIASDALCSDTVVFSIVVNGTSALRIPNVFTPNNDGVNDLFIPDVFGIRLLECTIMNRYGEVVHSWMGTRGYWDGYTFPAGLPCPEGTYFFWIKAEGLDGKQYNENGTISLLR